MPTPTAVGVDVGGTWIRLKGLNAQGRCIWSLNRPAPSVDELAAFLKKHLKRFHGKLPTLAVGSRGIWKQSKRRRVKRALDGLADHIVVMSDVEAAWMAAFTHSGIIVISGTGSIAYGRKADGTFARAGGLGPDKGDEGSGYWIGREWIRRSGRREGVSVRQIARRAPLVIARARRGNPVARSIIREAQLHLADLVQEIIQRLRWKGVAPLSVHGSVLMDAWFKRGFLRRLKDMGIASHVIVADFDVAASLALHGRATGRSPLQHP